MNDPVVAADGLSYERAMISLWLNDHNTSPRTNAVLAHKNLTPNVDLRSRIINDWREKQSASISPEKIVVDITPEGVLGEGAWGVVRKGTMCGLNSKNVIPVAIKTIPNASQSAQKVADALAPEIKLLKIASFRCLHTAKLYGTTIKDGRLCIVMKLYKQTLTKVITSARDNKLTPDVTLRYSIALFRALAELHEAGIVSRDIKPDNILFDEYDNLVIADFGISFQMQNTVGQMYANKTEAKGTFNYMCSEMFIRGANVDCKVDVYAGACCIVQMLTGRMPFYGFQIQEIVGEVRYEKKMPPEALSADIPANIKTVIHQCLQADPTSRPTAAVVYTVLEKLYLPPVVAVAPVQVTIYIHIIYINFIFSIISIVSFYYYVNELIFVYLHIHIHINVLI